MAEETYTISGYVIDAANGEAIAELRVETWDLEKIIDHAISSVTTGADGFFQFDYTASFLTQQFEGREPSLYFKIFSGETLIENTEETTKWTKADGDVTLEIPVEWSTPSDPPPPRGCDDSLVDNYTVTGVITSPERASLGDLTVQIVDKGIGDDFVLMETTSDKCGNFTGAFSSAAVEGRGKKRPDVQAKVYLGNELIAASEVRYNATGYETLEVAIPAGTRGLPSEHESLTGAITPHYSGALRDLQENDSRQDITYLANKSGWDARAVALAALADQFSAASAAAGADLAIPAPFFYALFRSGLSANEDTLYRASVDTVSRIWLNAARQGIIPAALEGDIDTMAERFKALSSGKFLNGTPVAGVSTMSAMLAVAGLTQGEQQRFTDLLVENREDIGAFWENVTAEFGQGTSDRLQADGKLAYLTLNNAQLMKKVRAAIGAGATDLAVLAKAGLHGIGPWSELLTADVPIPAEIPGNSDEEKRFFYAEYLAAQVTASYPTASVAQMIGSGELPIENAPEVQDFLNENQGGFEIGAQAVEQYIAENELDVSDEVVSEVKRIQRVYQIAPTNDTMIAMINSGVDSAAYVAQYERKEFLDQYAGPLGGSVVANKVYDQSVAIHNVVLNLVVSYLTAKNGITLGSAQLGTPASGLGTVLQSLPKGPGVVNVPGAGQVIAYPTLESLFGEMDFCDCEHCRSILSPAAYLTDLLKFIDRSKPGYTNPLNVLFQRRPDIGELPLTCENTNTALPYIDVVNETLEYFITHSLSLAGYPGHDTGTMKSEDLLASPAFVNDIAYATLATQRFPLPLPFHRPLESLRRHYEKFDVALPLAMEKVRRDDALERGSNPYGMRDIMMEELRLSRAEYEILTDSTAVPLWRMYGFASGTSDATAIAGLSNAKAFSRRLDISYEDLAALVQTRFINPNADLLPKLQRLGVSFPVMKQLKTGAISDSQFNALLPTGALAPDANEYGGNIAAWVKDNANYARIMSLITLTDVTLQSDPCSFDILELRKAEPMTSVSDTSTRLAAADFIRILRFIRLWKKLGWTMEETDDALCALFRGSLSPLTAADIDTPAELDAGFLAMLPRLGVVVRVMRALGLTPKRDLQSLLTLWSDIDTFGANALYRRMFLNPTILAQDPVYADNGYGAFLTNSSVKIVDHVESLRAAFNLTGEEFDQITASLGFDATTALTVANISAIFRRGYLARALRISVRELLLLMSVTGLDPFDPVIISATVVPAVPLLAELVGALRDSSLKVASALYLVWNHDLSGSSAPTEAQTSELARLLREDFLKIDREFDLRDDPDGEIARSRMTIVYGNETTDFFFKLLNETFLSEAPYVHFDPSFGSALAAAVATAGGVYGTSNTPRLAYDEFNHTITFTGALDLATRNAIKSVVTDSAVVAEVPSGKLTDFQNDFRAAVDALYDANDAIIGPFFARYEDLRLLYFAVNFADPDTKRSALLGIFLPTLISERKTQQALQRIADAGQVDRTFAETLVNATPASAGLHYKGNTARPALDDLLALATQGISVQIYDGATTGSNPHVPTIDGDLSYSPSTTPLPGNITTPGGAISGVWSGSIEAPASGRYNFIIDAEVGSSVSLRIDGSAVTLTNSGANWTSTSPIALKSGVLYAFELTVQNVKNTLSVQWETLGRGRSVITAASLYPGTLMSNAGSVYVRFLKSAALANALKLTAAEVARPQLAGVSWLNAIPASGTSGSPSTLHAPFRELLDYAFLKRWLSAGSDRLLTAVSALAAGTPDPAPLYALTGWDAASVATVAAHFGGVVADLKGPRMLRRAYDAFTLAEKMGISISALLAATTNEPTATIVRDLQSALRARYNAEDWRTVVGPVNDQMRSLQRDALVAYILHQFRSNTLTQHIDTPEKLFEYFLMDVQMEPCMQTSRIRHAISSVQLFIERCIMNLEPGIAPIILSAKQWEWMKRYRVWEANRKVFLFPENWLEPELRDDKSPFFKELESELLQSDITEDSASVAMLNYLSKLEEVAKLEPCSLFHIAGSTGDRSANIDHVVARTPGASRKYYYRRREYGYWTPWEQIKLDIEDNPVVPVVWRDRLLLFWLRLIKSGPNSAGSVKPSGSNTVDSITLPNDPRVQLKAVLCWSEYYNGKWQPTKSTNVEVPADLYSISASSPYAFDRSSMPIYVEEVGDGLQVSIAYSASFIFYNTHGEPLAGGGAYAPVCMPGRRERWIMTGTHSLSMQYFGPGCGPGMTRDVLKPDLPYRLVEVQHPVPDVWHAPLFYYDARHVFYVSSTQQEVPIRFIQNYGLPTTTSGGTGTVTGTVTSGVAPATSVPGWAVGGLSGGSNQLTNSGAVQMFLSEDANINQAIGNTMLVQYGGMQIGPAGAVKGQ